MAAITKTKNLSTDANSSTDIKKILLARQNLRQFYTLYKQKCSNPRPLLFIIFPQGFGKLQKFGQFRKGGKKTFKRNDQMKKSIIKTFCRGNFTPFVSKSFQIWDHFFTWLFPEDSEYLKSWDIGGKDR